ncbi:MAG: hypothetical protein WC262_08265 [Bacteroidales bacterium]|jgi:hypothetical protein
MVLEKEISKKESKDDLYIRVLKNCIYNVYNKESKILSDEKNIITLLGTKLANYITLNTYLDFHNYAICESIKIEKNPLITNKYSNHISLCFHLEDKISGEIVEKSNFTIEVNYIIISQLKNKILLGIELKSFKSENSPYVYSF